MGRCLGPIALLGVKENLGPGTLSVFSLLGLLVAVLPLSEFGGPGAALWALNAVACAAGLAIGLGGGISEKSILQSSWFQAQPPSRILKGLASCLGTYLSLGVVLFPSLVFPLYPLQRTGGGFRRNVAFRLEKREGPGWPLILRDERVVLLRPNDPALVERIVLSPFLVYRHESKVRDAVMEISENGRDWKGVGSIGIEKKVLVVPAPVKGFKDTIYLRKKGGVDLFFSPGSLRLLGKEVASWKVWVLCWLSVLNFALFFGVAVGWAGTFFSRPVGIVVGTGLFLFAISEQDIMGILPLKDAAEHIAPGIGLGGGKGWALLLLGLLLSMGLGLRPGIKAMEEYEP